MSLLMQALKKAEQTKQKQQSDAVLSLSPTDNHPEPVFSAPVSTENAQSSAAPASNAALSLSPNHQEAETHFIEDVLPATPINPPISALAAQYEPFMEESLTSPPVSASYKAADAATISAADTATNSAAADAVLEVPTAKSEQAMADRLQRPRIDPEQLKTHEKIDPALAAEQKKAKSVFASKTSPTDHKKTWLLGLGTISLLMLAGFGYVYWQSNQLTNQSGLLGNAANTVPTPLPAPASNATANEVAAASAASAASAAETSMPPTASATTSSEVSAQNPTTNSATNPHNANKAPTSELKIAESSKKNSDDKPESLNGSSDKSPKRSPNRSSGTATNLPGHVVHDANAIQIQKGNSGNQINPALSSAYQAFLTGDVATAERQYQSVLVQEPHNRDALLGLAALALNQRAADKAGSFYGKLLELDPNDPEAIAGLTSLQQGDPVQSESRLKKALNLHPNAGAILFALGNLYAQQGRWSDAQQNYFRAFATQPANADYAFNLAVSLDRLNQSKLAKDYYQRALDAGQSGPGNFSRSKVQQRLTALEKALNE
jgi:tetratricopeptide (TPR) repeat protein